VILEHRGLDRLPAEEATRVRTYGWKLLLPWYRDYVAERGSAAADREEVRA
jgi:hypothetical protein